MAEPTNHNEAGEVAPSNVEEQAPTVSEEHAPSTDSDQATDIPSANSPDPTSANADVNPNAAGEKPTAEGEKSETSTQTSAKKTAVSAKDKAEKPAAKKPTGDGEAPPKAAKKEKAPTLEDKPFTEFIQQDFLPNLRTALEKKGVQNLNLDFTKKKIEAVGFKEPPECWQIIGSWQEGQRNFNLYFPEEDIQGKKFFSCNEGKKPSTIELFLGDERKMTLDLMLFGAIQRLNGQKWLARN